jgi:hypothetical protein
MTCRFLMLLLKIKSAIFPESLFLPEFPVVTIDKLKRFKSWDRELGWVNKPNTTKIDRSDRDWSTRDVNVTFSTDRLGSRVCSNPFHRTLMTFYGDSYCMCREVNDDQTYQWILGKKLNSRVSNYGVGNYGLDQAILRLESQYERDPSPMVCISVTTATMARACSVYRHYLSPGNYFGIKPRFIIKSGDLLLVPSPIKEIKDLLRMQDFKSHFEKYDRHYSGFYSKRFWFHVRDLIKNRKKAAAKVAYMEEMWSQEEKLFFKMIERYDKLSKKYRFKPFFLLQYQKKHLTVIEGMKTTAPCHMVISKAKQLYPNITFLDELDILKKRSIEMYTGGHRSHEANQRIAEYIEAILG